MRAPPPMFSDNRHGKRFMELMDDPDERLRLYVYRWENNCTVKPAIYIGPPFEDLFEYLQDKHDGGEFNIMVRRGETMLLSEIGADLPTAEPTRGVRSTQIQIRMVVRYGPAFLNDPCQS